MNQDFKTLVDNCGLSLRGASLLLGDSYSRIRNMYYGRTFAPNNVMNKMRSYEKAAKEIFEND